MTTNFSNQRRPSFKPRCPNHNEELMDIPFPMPKKGVGICPVSGAPFEFEVDVDEEKMIKDKNGNLVPTVGWSLSGEENE